MPAQPRTSSGDGRPPGRPDPLRPPPLPRRGPRSSGAARASASASSSCSLLVWLVFMLAVPFWAWCKVDKIDAMPADEGRPDEQGGNTYLIVGSDSPDDLTEAEREELGTGGEVGQRTDTIMLLHTGDGPNMLMSIPRDSIVAIPGHGEGRRSTPPSPTAAPSCSSPPSRTRPASASTTTSRSASAASSAWSTPWVAWRSARSTAMNDPDANLDIPKGCQEADGKTALGYARSRKTYAELGDIDRARAPARGRLGDRRQGPVAVDLPQPGALLRARHGVVRRRSGERGHRPALAGPLRLRDDAGRRATPASPCGVPIQDLAVTWDEERSEELFSYIRRGRHGQHPRQPVHPERDAARMTPR